MSRLPEVFLISFIRLLILSADVTSRGMQEACEPISFFKASRFSILLALKMTEAPAAASVFAKCFPNPDEAPVISAVLPSKLKISFMIYKFSSSFSASLIKLSWWGCSSCWPIRPMIFWKGSTIPESFPAIVSITLCARNGTAAAL